MKILPDDISQQNATPEEQMKALGRRLFATDPAKVKDRQAQEEAEREKVSGGAKRKGRPRRAAPASGY
jgi:hypothetical protein